MKILIMFHTPSNAGYAMTALEKTFMQVCENITGKQSNVFFSFSNLEDGAPKSLPDNFKNIICLNYSDAGTFEEASKYIKNNSIDFAFCFDVQPHAKVCRMLRSSGIKRIVSYWGSTISSENSFLKLQLKKIMLAFNTSKPDHFIFESEAMRHLAVFGRGISRGATSVIPTGVEISRYRPRPDSNAYIRAQFNLPDAAKIVFYSGHMEERKGVRTIIESAIHIHENALIDAPLYFLICGNRPGEEKAFLDLLQNTIAEPYVIFAGYRQDLDQIMPGCDLGVVASTGWDSFPMSTLEMAACGLPIVVSRLQGLVETLEEGKTGLTFTPGNKSELSKKIVDLLSDPHMYKAMSANAVERIHQRFTKEHQIDTLVRCLSATFKP